MLPLRASVAVSVAMFLVSLACAHALHIAAGHQEHGIFRSHNRRLQNLQNSDTTLQYIDFTSLPADLPGGNGTLVDEQPFQANINITTDAINEPYDVQEGAFHLGPFEVNQIMDAVTSQLVSCPASSHPCTYAQCSATVCCPAYDCRYQSNSLQFCAT